MAVKLLCTCFVKAEQERGCEEDRMWEENGGRKGGEYKEKERGTKREGNTGREEMREWGGNDGWREDAGGEAFSSNLASSLWDDLRQRWLNRWNCLPVWRLGHKWYFYRYQMLQCLSFKICLWMQPFNVLNHDRLWPIYSSQVYHLCCSSKQGLPSP